MKDFELTSESVSEGHPDKVADQISDAIVDKSLKFNPEIKTLCIEEFFLKMRFCNSTMPIILIQLNSFFYRH